MDFDIRAATARLASRKIVKPDGEYAFEAAVLQFNGYLIVAQERYPDSMDIQSLSTFYNTSFVPFHQLSDAVERLLEGLEILPDDVDFASSEMSQKFGILRSERQLEADFNAYKNDKGGLGLLFFDVDYFKRLNTKYTETKVDLDVLRPLHNLLLDITQARGFVYSIGGDEFLLLLRNVGKTESFAFAQRLCDTVREHHFQIGDVYESLTLSIGVACYSSDCRTLLELRQSANLAENHAKKSGRDRVVAVSETVK